MKKDSSVSIESSGKSEGSIHRRLNCSWCLWLFPNPAALSQLYEKEIAPEENAEQFSQCNGVFKESPMKQDGGISVEASGR
ncbi:hypothetical protein AVEN_114442-1 [Araneus ventricosus]|uniref:Uncharacterized protein n=1 Tax=Araneus ventricosus TaxID=182803 RepID=A0A4Y2IIQ5_ARAVE|nr:hypothetical protein AVEN_114442-1 [Araneus ventricosus]